MPFVIDRDGEPLARLTHEGEAVLNRPERGVMGMCRVKSLPVVGRPEQQVGSGLPGLAHRTRIV